MPETLLKSTCVIGHDDIFISAEGSVLADLNLMVSAAVDPIELIDQNFWGAIQNKSLSYVYTLILERVRLGIDVKYSRHWHEDDQAFLTEALFRAGDGGDVICEWTTTLVQESEPPAILPYDARTLSHSSLVVSCSWCHKVRVGSKKWRFIEDAISILGIMSLVPLPEFSHGMCGPCFLGAVDRLRGNSNE